jgi:hypothetical protein
MALTPEEIERQKQLLNSLYEQYSVTEDILDLERQISVQIDEQNSSITGYIKGQTKIKEKILERAKIDKSLAEINAEVAKLMAIQDELAGNLSEAEKTRLIYLQNIVAESRKTLNLLDQEINALKENLSLSKAIGNEFKNGLVNILEQEFSFSKIWEYLQQIDGVIRKQQLSLGVSGEKAKMMREQFEASVNAAANLGASAKDIAELQDGITQATGRAFSFREAENLALVRIAKGTGLQNDEVGKLVGTMTQYGLTIESSKKLIEDSVNSTAKLGLSSSAVLKKLTANIDKLNSYRFDKGVKGIEEMAKASEKFKFSMDGAFAAAEKFRTLEGLLEAGAQLQVLGGEFAKIDAFKFSFLARNKPQEFAVEMAKLTKGMATFNKTTGEFDVTDVDYDRLRAVAEATGRSLDDLVQQAKQVNQMNFAKKQILVGTDEEREMLAGLAKFKPGSTIGTIQIGDKEVKLNELTRDQIDLYKQTQKTLEQRAKDSQNFNEALTNLSDQLKSTLLPILKVINSVLDGFHAIFDGLRDENGKLNGFLSILPLGGILISSKILSSLWGWLKTSMVFQKAGGLLGKTGAAATTQAATTTATTTAASGGAGAMGGFASAAKLAAIGVAAVGIGFGFKMAAEGVSQLAVALKDLDGAGFAKLAGTVTIIGLAMAGVLAVGIKTLGSAAGNPQVALGLAAIGIAAAGIGWGIGQAATGIGELVKSFGTLEKVNMLQIGAGIAAIAGAAYLMSTPMALVGLGGIAIALGGISALDFTNVIPLQNLHFVDKDIENMKQMANLLAQINAIDTSKLNALKNLFSEGTMKVQIAGNSMIRNEITLDIEGEKIFKRIEKMVELKTRKSVGDTKSIKV